MYRLIEDDKKEINDTMHHIVNDLYSIWEQSATDEIIVKIDFDYNKKKKHYLHISGTSIYISKFKNGKTIAQLQNDCMFCESAENKYFFMDLEFIRKYERNRELVLEATSKELKRKENDLSKLHEIKGILSENKETDLEVNFPISVNRHEIEVTHEDGKTIGTIDFGDKIVRIITTSGIVLVNRDEQKEEDKVKRKDKE